MSARLQLASSLALPANEAVTQKYGFIGRSGSGKSYGSMKMAELFLGAGAQIIALDWVGIWWSLRLNADGKRPGFEHVYIFGGEHADVALQPESGALMADLVVDKHISVVLDVMHFRKAERTRFATAFAEQFFHRKKTARTACHLFIEEAQAYLPQMVRGEEARMVGVFEDIGKVGRNYGIGTTLISQRPQAINKDVLNQVEVLLAFQTNGPQERKAIRGGAGAWRVRPIAAAISFAELASAVDILTRRSRSCSARASWPSFSTNRSTVFCSTFAVEFNLDPSCFFSSAINFRSSRGSSAFAFSIVDWISAPSCSRSAFASVFGLMACARCVGVELAS
jgi:hypothetical protein